MTLSLGPVHLNVADLDRQIRFYESVIGLRLHHKNGNTAALGVGAEDLLVLHHIPGASAPGRATGLYHFALLVPDRVSLARTLRHLAQTGTPLQGFADHYVSEAIYLPDAEGNGIEIYRDRPRETWEYRGEWLHMGTDPLDVNDLLGELNGDRAPWQGLATGTTMGHVHLHVAGIEATEAFYLNLLDMDVMTRIPSATFLSWAGYHHHLGANTWNGVGAPPPPPDATGLRWYTLRLPDGAALDSAHARLDAAGVPLEALDDGWLARDPAGNSILLTA